MTTEIICPRCHGTGSGTGSDRPALVCQRCYGMGKILEQIATESKPSRAALKREKVAELLTKCQFSDSLAAPIELQFAQVQALLAISLAIEDGLERIAQAIEKKEI